MTAAIATLATLATAAGILRTGRCALVAPSSETAVAASRATTGSALAAPWSPGPATETAGSAGATTPEATHAAAGQHRGCHAGGFKFVALLGFERGRDGRERPGTEQGHLGLNPRHDAGFFTDDLLIVFLGDGGLEQILLRHTEFFVQLGESVAVLLAGFPVKLHLLVVETQAAEAAPARAPACAALEIAAAAPVAARRVGDAGGRRISRGQRERAGEGGEEQGDGAASGSREVSFHNSCAWNSQSVRRAVRGPRRGRIWNRRLLKKPSVTWLVTGAVSWRLISMTGTSDNRAASRPTLGALNQPVRAPRRRTLLVVAVAVLLTGGAFAFWNYIGARPPAWLSRWRVQHYLKGQAHSGNFKVENFVFPSRADLAKDPRKAADVTAALKGGKTGKDFDALRDEYFTLKTSALVLERGLARSATEWKEAAAELDALTQQLSGAQTAATTHVSVLESNAVTCRARAAELQKKTDLSRDELQAREAALAPIVSDLWEFQRGWLAQSEGNGSADAAEFVKSRAQLTANLRLQFEKAGSYAEMYKLIGQELWVASRLLDSANPVYVRSGMGLALSASQHALNDAQNGWVAARICDGYLLPHLDAADDTNRRSQFNRDNLLSECADIFRRNNEYPGVIRTYQIALATAGTPQKADSARAQISMAYEQAGDLKESLRYIREIKETNDFRGVLRRAPRLEQQLKTH